MAPLLLLSFLGRFLNPHRQRAFLRGSCCKTQSLNATPVTRRDSEVTKRALYAAPRVYGYKPNWCNWTSVTFYVKFQDLQLSISASFSTDAFDNDLIMQTLQQILQGETVQIPVYDFVTHSRWATRSVDFCVYWTDMWSTMSVHIGQIPIML